MLPVHPIPAPIIRYVRCFGGNHIGGYQECAKALGSWHAMCNNLKVNGTIQGICGCTRYGGMTRPDDRNDFEAIGGPGKCKS